MPDTTTPPVRSLPITSIAAGAAAAIALVWAFWPTLATMAERWSDDPRYSHGYLVPGFSLYLLWSRRKMLDAGNWSPSLLGLPILAAGLAMRGIGIAFYVEWLAAAAIVPCLGGVVLLAGGRMALRWSWPAIAFLLFMIPLPFQVEVALAHPLQGIATRLSTYAIQTLGLIAVAEGNTIRMDGGIRLGVVEACSGLSMLINFFALSTATAILLRRPIYERVLVIAAAIPIALAANVTRITVTAILHKTAGSEIADRVFHDLAGWLMMPLALLMLWAGLWIMARLIVDDPRGAPLRRPVAAY